MTKKARIPLGLVAAAALAVSSAWAADCSVKIAAELDMVNGPADPPIVAGRIGTESARFLIDTGAYWGAVPEALAKTGDRREQAGGFIDAAGFASHTLVKIPEFGLGPLTPKNFDFWVLPRTPGNLVVLGRNFLQNFDIEIDPVGRKVKLLVPLDCGGPIYWPHSDADVIPYDTDDDKAIVVPVTIDGTETMALVDTGNTKTNISTAAHRMPGSGEYVILPRHLDDLLAQKEADGEINRGSATVSATGASIGQSILAFDSFGFGGVVIHRPLLHIMNRPTGLFRRNAMPVIIGMSELAPLHLYIATKQQKIYLTTLAGDLAAGRKLPPDAANPLDVINVRNLIESGDGHLGAGDFPAALAAYEQAATLMPKEPRPHVGKAIVLSAKGESAAAIAEADRAIAENASFFRAYEVRSEAYARMGDWAHATADLEMALGGAPNSSAAHQSRARLFQRQEEYAKARVEWDAAVAAASLSWDAYAGRAAFLSDIGEGKAALADADQAVQLNPKSAAMLERRSIVRRRLGDFDAAIEDIDAAQRLAPQSFASHTNRCRLLARAGRLDAARKECDAAVAKAPKSWDALECRGYFAYKSGRLDDALKDFDAALALKPDVASALYGRSLIRRQRGDAVGADADLATAKHIWPAIDRVFDL